ncbi:hypothetical protein CP960_11995 [Malaciobacter halophilus]|uniref:L,D-TPase catalytic domain-containing protein n=1 Tax=Malaciobacter halophilus TaxID=197482 RepID=A0A2N1J051_9BACT|nr:L,D-transpeptidase family protein [Malaciobacter halophilus]AXH10383.1 murein L,D-transpeptidase, YcbB/YkuD family [Malaciobacter halophilus]PKI79937.1 hypothetical protein CP960_11995 [Malaciobacter halophilus]
MKKFLIIILSFFSYLYSNSLKDEIKLINSSNKTILQEYYKFNNYNYYWISKESKIKPIAYSLINSIEKDILLKPYKNRIFNMNKIYSILKTQQFTQIEIELTLLFEKYASFLNKSIININRFDSLIKKQNQKITWQKYPLKNSKVKLLNYLSKTNSFERFKEIYKLTFPNSMQLVYELKKLEEMKEKGIKFLKLDSSTILKLNHNNQAVENLRIRLYQEGFKNSLDTNNLRVFDKKLENIIKKFQKRYGLKVDGEVGKNTYRYLNLSLEDKIEKIRLNIQRLKWLPKTLGDEFFIVNIPEFKLKLYENKNLKLSMSVVVGEKNFPTSIFSNRISNIVLNPYWRIPKSIVKKDILPKLEKDKKYLEKMGINLHENWEEDSFTYDSKYIDWSYYLNNNMDLPFRFIQQPNEKNPLGKIKFSFPNAHAIYLHDTPKKNFFNYNKRAFSHGCIRVEKPIVLLKNIYEIENNKEEIKSALKTIQSKNKQKITLKNSIPIHIVYLTAWIDEKGNLQIRDDIYGLDNIQKKAIDYSL